MRACYHPDYHTPLLEGHRFPMGKFPALFEVLRAQGLLAAGDVVTPEEAPLADLRRVHTERYLSDLAQGTLPRDAVRRLGLPPSPALWRRSRLAVAGTLAACRMALEDGVAANLAGGTHHAFADRGEGFCVLNDVAIAIRRLRADGAIRRALVVDLDVHQGNGTAAIFADDPETYTFSMHGGRNYPFTKERSSRDVALPDGTGDDAYLHALACHLPAVFAEAAAELVVYLAGVDTVAGDRFGRLALSPAGLARRDRCVLGGARAAGTPVAITLSGGYAATPEATAALHAIVHREARAIFSDRSGARSPGTESHP